MISAKGRKAKECGVEDCSRPVKARGKCNMHYLRERMAELPRVDVVCPNCRGVRQVREWDANQMKRGKLSTLCRSCSGRLHNSATKFEQRQCADCGRHFQADVRQARRRCDECRTRKGPPPTARNCVVCGRTFMPRRNRSVVASVDVCSPACRQRLRADKQYFGGRMSEAQGWATKTCQCCGKSAMRRWQVHHVYGHPDHSRLVVLCHGCHYAITMMSRLKDPLKTGRKIIWYAAMQKQRGPVSRGAVMEVCFCGAPAEESWNDEPRCAEHCKVIVRPELERQEMAV